MGAAKQDLAVLRRAVEPDPDAPAITEAHHVAEGSGCDIGQVDIEDAVRLPNRRAVASQGLAHEPLDVDARADGLARGDHLALHFEVVDRLLREDRPGSPLAFDGPVPFLVERGLLGTENVALEELELVDGRVVAPTPQEEALEDRFEDGVRVDRDRDGDAQRVADRPMLPQQDREDDPVDLVVETVERDDLDLALRLAVAVDAAFALLVAGRVPGEVVVDDRVEAVLEVDPLGQAVGRDEDAVLVLANSRTRASRSSAASSPVTASTATSLGPSAARSAPATYSAVAMKRQKTIGLDPSRTSPRTISIPRASLASPRPASASASRARSRRRRRDVVASPSSASASAPGTTSAPSALSSSTRSRTLRRPISSASAIGLGVGGLGPAAEGHRRGGWARPERAQERQRRPPPDALTLGAPQVPSRTVSRA